MKPAQRRQVIQALKDAADALVKPVVKRKRSNRKPRETPRFKTTDEMLEYAMRHKGERDVPALGIRYRGDTSDSVIPDTFGRVWAANQDWVVEVAFDGQRSSTVEAVQRTDQRKQVIGSLELSWKDEAAVVTDIRVRGQVAGKGVATSMYEAAAKLAETRGLPLRSDTSRYPGADGFWKKQVAKNRATAVPIGPNKVGVDPEKVRYYQLNYPPPSSLR